MSPCGCQKIASRALAAPVEELKRTDALWTVLYVEGFEPTNNTAESTGRHGFRRARAQLRHALEEGSRFVERTLSVHALRQQRRNLLVATATTSRPAQLAA